MLILFDIDGTILLTHGQGMQAMQDSGRELVGDHFTIDGASFSGCLDPLIWRQLCEINGVNDSNGLHETFRIGYRRHLHRRLIELQAPVTVLPGVVELIAALRDVEDVTLGLVTGNYPETGQLKIETAGIDFGVFDVFGWGSDGNHRRDLPPVAVSRYREKFARDIDSERVIIVGDTPHDVDCAKFNGFRCIAVATGAFSMEDLDRAGADHTVNTLASTEALVDWICDPAQRISG